MSVVNQQSVSNFAHNIQHLLAMSVEEKQHLASKLQAELAEFRERERLYTDKRRELQELELKYRKKQDVIVGRVGSQRAKLRVNEQIIGQLLE